MVLTRKEYAKKIDMEVFPGIQGGPLMHIIAAKAVCFQEALKPEFKVYQSQILKNSKAFASELAKRGYRIVSGGTDTHLFLVDLTNKNVTGRDAAATLDRAGITVNKNLIPFDKTSPFVTSGVRIGTPAVTTRGMKESEMAVIAELIDRVVTNLSDESVISDVKNQVLKLVKKFPLYDGLVKRLEE